MIGDALILVYSDSRRDFNERGHYDNDDSLCVLTCLKRLRNAQYTLTGCILLRVLMTLHNLDDHISWLLQNRQIPPARLIVYSIQPLIEFPGQQQSSSIQDTKRLATENAELLQQYGEVASDNSAVNVVYESSLPADVPIISRELQAAQRDGKFLVGENMAKLSSASKSAKPSLLSQYQLASPAPTTGSSISAVYAARFHKDNTSYQNVPIASKPRILDENLTISPSKRGTSNLLGPERAMLSPCRSLQRIHTKHGEIDYLDLTGEGQVDSDRPGSSSSDVFSHNQTIWSADAVSRTEPIRRGKKRKSDEIAGTTRLSQPKTMSRLGKDKKQMSPALIDDFVDIDMLSEVEDLPPPYSAHANPFQTKSENKSVRETVESGLEESDMEEYRITETISRTETRIRKGLSRKPSNGDGKGLSKLAALSNKTSTEIRPDYPPEHTSPRRLDDLRNEYSPAKHHLSLPHRSLSPAITQSKTRKNKCKNRIIEDSEEDDFMESMSPNRIRDSRPQTTSMVETPQKEKSKATQIQVTPPTLQKMTRETDCNRMVIESPTHVASQNNLLGPFMKTETASESVRRHSPTKLQATPKGIVNEQASSAPAFVLSSEDKILVNIYLQNPKSLTGFDTLLEVKYQEVKDEIDQLLDAGVIIPDYLRDRRKKISEQKKSLTALRPLYDQHALLKARKNELKKSIYAAFDADDDELANEQQITLKGITEQVWLVETELGQLIRRCGIAEANFDIHNKVENTQQSHNSNRNDAFQGANLAQRPSDSNNIGSTQVIYQTQISTEFTLPGLTSSRVPTEETLRLPNIIRGQNDVKPSHELDMRSLAAPESNMQPLAPKIWSEPGPFGKLSRTSPQRPRVDFDDDFPEDIPDDFEDEMLDGHHQDTSAYAATHDEFGDFGEDDDLMAQFAEEIDQHQHKTDPIQAPLGKDTCGERNTSSKMQKPNTTKNMSLPVHPGHADLMRYAWSEDVKKVLKENFHLRGFRSNQLEAINATLGGKDAFVLMPTGGGKSLCYQIPAVVQSGTTRGVTVVVSPLISLMQDQVDHLNHFGIPAFYINGEVDLKDKNKIMSYLKEHEPENYIKLLYVTPEMVKKSSALMSAFTDLYRRRRLARFVIDEAHCVSQWGHDFRPDYKAVGEVRTYFPTVPIIALTATATENVKIDVIHNLSINGCEVFSQSFNRPNLIYEIRPKQKAADVLTSIVDTIKKQYRKQSGIVYTLSRANCEKMADDLRRNGIKAHHYHAGLKAEEKANLQKSWQQGKVHVIVATIAFGMGIDKPDVRFVIHHTIPKSLEGYYQETGRAGRDGKTSSCFLYYGYGDTRSLNSFIEKSDGSEEEKARQRKMLNRMVQYCENKSDCRRVELLGYFGERFRREDCNHTCDNCNSSSIFETQDVSELARAALNVVKTLHRDNITILDCIKVLLGDKLRKETAVSPDQIEGFGAANGMHRGEIERIIYRLISENALMERNIVNRRGFANQYLELGSNSRDFMSGRRKLKLQIRVSPNGPKAKSKFTKKPIKFGTGVAAAELYAQSTDVSSPIRGISRPRKDRNIFVDDEAEVNDEELDDDAEDVDNHGYTRDGFVVPDDSDDGFEPVHGSIHRSKSTKSRPQLGPPITRDQRLIEANLNEVHLLIIQHFVSDAKKLEEKIRNEKGWKRSIFTDLQFREMAINWTTTIEDMLDISGINKGRVEMVGPRFLPLVEKYNNDYESMMAPREERDRDGNHKNVIVLISDEEEQDEEDEEEEEDKYDEMEQDNQPSRYFPSSAKSLMPKEQFTQTAPELKVQGRHFPMHKPRSTSKPSSRGGRGSSLSKSHSSSGLTGRPQNSGSGARAVSRRGGRRGSSSFPKSRSASGASNGVLKRKSSSKRPSSGSNSTGFKNTFKHYAKKRDNGSGGGNGGGRAESTTGTGSVGFGMMPT